MRVPTLNKPRLLWGLHWRANRPCMEPHDWLILILIAGLIALAVLVNNWANAVNAEDRALALANGAEKARMHAELNLVSVLNGGTLMGSDGSGITCREVDIIPPVKLMENRS